MALKTAILVFAVAAFAGPGLTVASGETVQPQCVAALAGKMWPEQANRNTDALRLAAQSGELQLCSKGRDSYRWQSLSVNVRELQAQQRSLGFGSANLNSPDDAEPPEDPTSERPANESAGNTHRPRHRFHIIRRILGI